VQDEIDIFLESYHQQNINIFPIQQKGKRPLTTNGFKNASSKIGIINQYWSKHPNANVGIPTGKLNNIEVLDVDVKSGGIASLRTILKETGPLPTSQVVLTGGGGFHFYFKYSNRNYKNRTGILPGIDFKTDGGYVIAPPSVHESGRRYQWINFNYMAFMNREDECYTLI
jgi:putative DNA primase/helicase